FLGRRGRRAGRGRGRVRRGGLGFALGGERRGGTRERAAARRAVPHPRRRAGLRGGRRRRAGGRDGTREVVACPRRATRGEGVRGLGRDEGPGRVGHGDV